MTKPLRVEPIEKATNRSWKEWETWLNARGAKDLSHPAIAALVYEELEGTIESAGWWSQNVTVAYEQSVGRRAPGQRSDGSFEISVSKTIDGEREAVYGRCRQLLENVRELGGRTVGNVRTSVTPVRSYWKCSLDDGSKITWSVEQKSPGKALVVVTHAGLESADDGTRRRTFWQDFLTKLT